MALDDAGQTDTENSKTEKSVPANILQDLNFQNELEKSQGQIVVLNMDRGKDGVKKKNKKCC